MCCFDFRILIKDQPPPPSSLPPKSQPYGVKLALESCMVCRTRPCDARCHAATTGIWAQAVLRRAAGAIIKIINIVVVACCIQPGQKTLLRWRITRVFSHPLQISRYRQSVCVVLTPKNPEMAKFQSQSQYSWGTKARLQAKNTELLKG